MSTSRNTVTILTREEDVMMFSATYGDQIVEGISHYRIDNDKLYLDKLHLEGSTAGAIGRKVLWEMAKNLGRQLNVTEVMIQGGRRTTGKYIGKVPSPIKIVVDS